MSITLLIRFFLNIARWDFILAAISIYITFYQVNKDILDFES